jgi:hypothetical protein
MLDEGAEVFYGEIFIYTEIFFSKTDTYVHNRKRCWTRARRFFIPTPCGYVEIACMSMLIPISKMASLNMGSKVLRLYY